MSFGFDPGIILSALKSGQTPSINDTLQTLSNLTTQRGQQQHQQAQLAELGRQRQQEQQVADIYKQNADAPQNLASAFMRGGFGPQAYAAQDQASQMQSQAADQAKKKQEVEKAHREHIAAALHGVTEADYPARREELASSPFPLIAAYAKTAMPEKYDAAWVKRTVDSGLSVKDQAELDAKKDVHGDTVQAGEAALAERKREFDLRQQEIGESRAAREAVAKEKADAKAGNTKKDWIDFAKGIGTGARGSLAKELQRSINSGEGLQTLLQLKDGTFVNATPQQMHEAYTALNSLISKGGSQAASQIESLVPETLASKWANLKQKVLNEPQSADAQEFIKNILDTTAREMRVAHKQLREQQFQAVPNFMHLREENPKKFNALLHNAGIDPESVDELGQYAEASKKDAPKGAWDDASEARLQELERKAAARKSGGAK